MTNIEPWIASPDNIEQVSLKYCMISHLPACDGYFRVSLVDLPIGSGGSVIKHRLSAELVYVIQGNVLAFVNGEIRELVTGSTVFLPPNTAHGFKPHNGSAQLFVIHSPAVSSETDHEILAENFEMDEFTA